MNMKKLLCVALALSTAVIPTVAEASEGSADSGEKIIIWAATTDVKDIMDNYFAKEYPDVPYEIQLYSGNDYMQKLDAVLASDSAEHPDIISAEVSYGKRYISTVNATTSLYNIGIDEEELSVLTPAVIDFMRDENGEPMGVSWQVTPGGLFYRRSIAEKYFGVKTPEEFQKLVCDWDTFTETAQKLKELSGNEVKMIATCDDFLNPFLNGSRTQSWVVDDQLVIDDAVDELMNMTKEFYDNGYTQETAHWSTGWYQTLVEDKTLCYLLPTWGLNYQLEPNCTAADGTTSYGDWGIVQPPVPYTWGGTWLLNTSKDDAKSENIAKIMRYIISEEFQVAYAQDTGDFVSNISAQQKVSETCSSEFLNGQNHYEVFAAVAASVNPEIQSEYDGTIQGFLQNAALTPYMQGELEKDEAIDAFKDEVSLYYGSDIMVD